MRSRILGGQKVAVRGQAWSRAPWWHSTWVLVMFVVLLLAGAYLLGKVLYVAR